MPHLALGIIIMLAGAIVMAYGLYIRSARAAARGRTLVTVAEAAFLFLLGLIIVIAGIIVSFEPNTTAPR